MPYPDELIETYKKIVKAGQTAPGLITEEQLKTRAMDPTFRALREKSKADYSQLQKRQQELIRAQQVKQFGNNNGFERFRVCLMDVSNDPSAKEQNEMSMDMINCNEGANVMTSKLLSSLVNIDLSMAFPEDDFQALEIADKHMDTGIICFNARALVNNVQNPEVKEWLTDNKTLLECFSRSNSIQEYYATDSSLFLEKVIPDVDKNIETVVNAINPEHVTKVSIVQDLSSTITAKEREQIKDFINNSGIDKNDFLFTKAYKTGANGERTPMAKLDALKAAATGDTSISFEPMKPEERQKLMEGMKNPLSLSKEQLENKNPDFAETTKDIYNKLRSCESLLRRNEPEFNEIKKMTQEYMKIKKPTPEESYKFLRGVQQKARVYVGSRAKDVKNMNPTMKKYYDTLNDLSNSLVKDVGRASAARYQEKFNTKFIDKAIKQKNTQKKISEQSAKARQENELHGQFMSFSEKVMSGKMPHCNDKYFKDLVLMGTSSTLSPVFEKGATPEMGLKYKQDVANVLATQMILNERAKINGTKAMADPSAKLKVGPLEQMLKEKGVKAFTKAIANSEFVKEMIESKNPTQYFNQKGISDVSKKLADNFVKNPDKVKMIRVTITTEATNGKMVMQKPNSEASMHNI